MIQFSASITSYPARVSAICYAGLIALGAVVLAQPFCHAAGAELSPLDALFTATSAVCVTGLVVRSTGHDFSLAGQVVILLLIQVGGIGIMTITTYVISTLGSRIDLRTRALVSETVGARAMNLREILRNVLAFTLVVELAGAVPLFVRNLVNDAPLTAMWRAVFHSISAFCNAGFSLHDDSLSRFNGDPSVTLAVGGLIVIGGIGYPVMLDVWIKRRRNPRQVWNSLTLHSRVMLIGTAALLAIGAMAFLLLEWDGVLAGQPLWRRPFIALFHSVTCRTAGFNTVDVASLTNAMLFVSMLLMLIGAGPGSTGGGFKVTTLMILLLQAVSVFRGRARASVFRRTIPEGLVQRASVIVMLFAATAAVGLTLLLMVEQSSQPHAQSQGLFLDASFEVVSALCTVGLSVGVTSHLTMAGQAIIIVLMFVGRLGPISVFAALSRSARRETVEYPGEEVMIG